MTLKPFSLFLVAAALLWSPLGSAKYVLTITLPLKQIEIRKDKINAYASEMGGNPNKMGVSKENKFVSLENLNNILTTAEKGKIDIYPIGSKHPHITLLMADFEVDKDADERATTKEVASRFKTTDQKDGEWTKNIKIQIASEIERRIKESSPLTLSNLVLLGKKGLFDEGDPITRLILALKVDDTWTNHFKTLVHAVKKTLKNFDMRGELKDRFPDSIFHASLLKLSSDKREHKDIIDNLQNAMKKLCKAANKGDTVCNTIELGAIPVKFTGEVTVSFSEEDPENTPSEEAKTPAASGGQTKSQTTSSQTATPGAPPAPSNIEPDFEVRSIRDAGENGDLSKAVAIDEKTDLLTISIPGFNRRDIANNLAQLNCDDDNFLKKREDESLSCQKFNTKKTACEIEKDGMLVCKAFVSNNLLGKGAIADIDNKVVESVTYATTDEIFETIDRTTKRKEGLINIICLEPGYGRRKLKIEVNKQLLSQKSKNELEAVKLVLKVRDTAYQEITCRRNVEDEKKDEKERKDNKQLK